MQYPIIDTIVDAYQRNGWTSLDISTGKNLFDYNSVTFTQGVLDDQGNYGQSNVSHFTNEYIAVEPNTPYTISGTFFTSTAARIYFRTITGVWISRSSRIENNPYTFTTQNNCYNIQIQCPINLSLSDVQIEQGTQATPYEPYSEPKNDFPNRLKLPLPHYFPHPVIDALQRAAAGTQTADDTEILRHYLTPLGIGGI